MPIKAAGDPVRVPVPRELIYRKVRCRDSRTMVSTREPHGVSTVPDSLTADQIAGLRRSLLARQQELRSEVHVAEDVRRHAQSRASHEVTDRKDEADLRQQTGVDDAQAQRDLDELVQIQAALQRLQSDTYGLCSDCAEPIGLQRLLVRPSALRCARCQTAVEQARSAHHAQ